MQGSRTPLEYSSPSHGPGVVPPSHSLWWDNPWLYQSDAVGVKNCARLSCMFLVLLARYFNAVFRISGHSDRTGSRRASLQVRSAYTVVIFSSKFTKNYLVAVGPVGATSTFARSGIAFRSEVMRVKVISYTPGHSKITSADLSHCPVSETSSNQ